MTARLSPARAALAAVLLSLAPPARAADDVVTKLPAPVEDVAVADGGRTLVLKLRGQKGLAVYDAKTQKLRTLDLPTADFVFGAGGDTAVVFLKEANEVRSYNLKTLAQVRAKEFADPVAAMRVVMGHSRGDLAFVRVARGADQLSHTTNHLLDVAALSFVRPKGPQNQGGFGRNMSYRDNTHYRANGDMSRLTEWCTSHSPSGIYVYTKSDDGYVVRGNHDSAGHLAAGDDGRVYTGFGTVLDLSAAPAPDRPHEPVGVVARVPGQSLFPGIGGQFFLGIEGDGKLNVYQTGETTPLCALEAFAEWQPPPPRGNAPRPAADPKQPPGMLDQWTQGPLTLDKRVVFAPGAGHLVFLPYSDDRLVLRPFDLKGALEKTGEDYLLVLSNPPLRAKAGAKWEYPVAVLAKHGPAKFRLEQGPEGMTLSPAGALAWKPPAGVEGRAAVVVAVADGKANVVRHKFVVAFD